MILNKEILKHYNITEDDYVEWCKKNNLSVFRKDSKAEFFKRIQEGKIRRNMIGDLVDDQD